LSILSQAVLLSGVAAVCLLATSEAARFMGLARAVIMIVGAVLLFKGRKSAVAVFGLLLSLEILGNLVTFLTSDLNRLALGIGAVFSIALTGAVLFYSLRLRGQGTLT
jgi:hypothetical protein